MRLNGFECPTNSTGVSFFRDPLAGCQVYYECRRVDHKMEKYTWLCPPGTRFNPKTNTCRDWYDFILIEKLTLWRMIVFWLLQHIAFAGRLLTVRKPSGGGASPCGEAAKGLTTTITRPGRCLVPADLSSVGQTNVSCAVMRAQSPFRLTPLQNRQDQSTLGGRQPLEGQ